MIPYGLSVRQFDHLSHVLTNLAVKCTPVYTEDEDGRQTLKTFNASVLPVKMPSPGTSPKVTKSPNNQELSRLEGLGLVARGSEEAGGVISFDSSLGGNEAAIESFILVDLFGAVGINNLLRDLPPSRNWHPRSDASVERDRELDSTLCFVVLTKDNLSLVTAGSIKNKITIDILRGAATPKGRPAVERTLYLGM